APYVPQLSTVRSVLASTVDRPRGPSGAAAFTSRPSRWAVGRQASRAMVASAAQPASTRRNGGAACGVTAATTATPLPRATAWITIADAVAGPGDTPACRASTSSPATLHTFPGT